MSAREAIYYGLDVLILVNILLVVRTSKTIELVANMGFRWLVPGLFWGVAIIGLFRYEGTFRIVQTIVLIVMGILYYFVRSGLNQDGIIAMGRLTRYEDAGNYVFDENLNTLRFYTNKKQASVMFSPEQSNDVQNYLAKVTKKKV